MKKSDRIEKSRLIAVMSTKILVLEKTGPKQRYSLPGGILKKKETEVKALIREVREEIGLDLKSRDINYFISRKNIGSIEEYILKHYFILREVEIANISPLEPDKFKSILWMPWHKAIDFMDKDDRHAVTLYFEQLSV